MSSESLVSSKSIRAQLDELEKQKIKLKAELEEQEKLEKLEKEGKYNMHMTKFSKEIAEHKEKKNAFELSYLDFAQSSYDVIRRFESVQFFIIKPHKAANDYLEFFKSNSNYFLETNSMTKDEYEKITELIKTTEQLDMLSDEIVSLLKEYTI